jgi:hypothetical protein
LCVTSENTNETKGALIPMRSIHKARSTQMRHDAALERVLEHPRGQAILQASNGDAEHALRIIDSVSGRDRPLGEVIRLPSAPILDFHDVLDEDEAELIGSGRRFPFVAAVALGLAAWLVLAAIVVGVLALLSRLGVL